MGTILREGFQAHLQTLQNVMELQKLMIIQQATPQFLYCMKRLKNQRGLVKSEALWLMTWFQGCDHQLLHRCIRCMHSFTHLRNCTIRYFAESPSFTCPCSKMKGKYFRPE